MLLNFFSFLLLLVNLPLLFPSRARARVPVIFAARAQTAEWTTDQYGEGAQVQE